MSEETAVDQLWLTDWQTYAISDWPTADHVRHLAATSFSLLQQLCTVDSGIFYMAGVNINFSELRNEYFSTRML